MGHRAVQVRLHCPPVPLALRAWLTYSRRRFRRRTGLADPWRNRRKLIEELAPGKAFIDIGGMLFTDGDPAFWAEESGATGCVLYDGMDPSEEFQRKHAERSSDVKFVQGGLHDP